jgi:mRNA interferase MazF
MAIARSLFARGAVHLAALDATKGSDIRKTRPCLIVSPNELNQNLRTGYVAVDQLRRVDTERLVKRLGILDLETVREVLRVLQDMFAE